MLCSLGLSTQTEVFMQDKQIGVCTWTDLTVANAEQIRDFYASVIGWQIKPVSMGEYDDYSMRSPGTDNDVAGICHARGVNANLPAQWLNYFRVEDIDKSLQQVQQQGGKVITEIQSMGSSRYVVIKDPAGAVCALYQD